jgi:hypothetical protein
MTRDRWSFSKKVFSALAIIFIIVAALTGCGPTEPAAPLPTTPTSPGTPTSPTPPEEITSPPSEPEVPFVPQTILSLTGGDVFVKRAGTDTWVLIDVGTTLQPGDFIKSVKGSRAEITFFEGSTIELEGETQISLSEISLSDTGSTTIHLKQYFGDTVSRVKKLADADSSFEIETQAAVAAARGSVMMVTVLEDGTTTVTNIEGDIRVTAQGTEVAIPEGMQSTVKPGETPGLPELPEPPDGEEPPPEVVYFSAITTGVQADSTEAHIGGFITYAYLITNIGNMLMRSVDLTDNVTGIPVFVGGDLNTNSILDPGEAWLYSAFHLVTPADPSPLVNTATWVLTNYYNSTITAHDQCSVTVLPPPGISLVKIADTLEVHVTGNINYTYFVANTGSVPLDFIGLTDDVTGVPDYQSGDLNLNETLDVGETWVYTDTYTAILGDIGLLVNTAEAEGYWQVGNSWVSDTAQFTVTVLP